MWVESKVDGVRGQKEEERSFHLPRLKKKRSGTHVRTCAHAARCAPPLLHTPYVHTLTSKGPNNGNPRFLHLEVIIKVRAVDTGDRHMCVRCAKRIVGVRAPVQYLKKKKIDSQ